MSPHARILPGLLLLSESMAQAQKERRSDFSGVWTGADGDEFYTPVVWKDSSLIFSIEEHEDGRIFLSTETWQLIDHHSALDRSLERPDGGR